MPGTLLGSAALIIGLSVATGVQEPDQVSLQRVNAVPYRMKGGEQPLAVLAPGQPSPTNQNLEFLEGLAGELVTEATALAQARMDVPVAIGGVEVRNLGDLVVAMADSNDRNPKRLTEVGELVRTADSTFHQRYWDRLILPLFNDQLLRANSAQGRRLTRWGDLGERLLTDLPTGIIVTQGAGFARGKGPYQAAVLIRGPARSTAGPIADATTAVSFYKQQERMGPPFSGLAFDRVQYPPISVELIPGSRWRTASGNATFSTLRTTLKSFPRSPFDLVMREQVDAAGRMVTDYVVPAPPRSLFSVMCGRDTVIVVRDSRDHVVALLFTSSLLADSQPVQSIREALGMTVEGAERRWQEWLATGAPTR